MYTWFGQLATSCESTEYYPRCVGCYLKNPWEDSESLHMQS